MTNFIIFIAYSALLALVEIIAQINLKYSIDNNVDTNLYIGLLCYILVAYILYNSFHVQGLGHMNLAWSCLSIIISFYIGNLYFKEKVNHYTIISIIFALMAIYFVYLADRA